MKVTVVANGSAGGNGGSASGADYTDTVYSCFHAYPGSSTDATAASGSCGGSSAEGNADAVAATDAALAAAMAASASNDLKEGEIEVAPVQPATQPGLQGLLAVQQSQEQDATRRVWQPIGADSIGAQPLHAGAIFASLEAFHQAVRLDQKHKPAVVVHTRGFKPSNGAYVCRATHMAIQHEGFASATDGDGALDRQWWRHICAGACSFVAEARQAHGKRSLSTELGKVMHSHIQGSLLLRATSASTGCGKAHGLSRCMLRIRVQLPTLLLQPCFSRGCAC
jgi:hypothetical protein